MSRAGRWLTVLAVFVSLWSGASWCVAADKKPNKKPNPGKPSQSKTAGIKDDLNDAERDLKQSMKLLEQSQSELKTAQAQVQKLHERLRDKHTSAAGLPAALEGVAAAKSAWEAAAVPVRNTLKSNAEYQQAQRELEQAEQQVASLKSSSAPPDEEAKGRLAAAAQDVLNAKTKERRFFDDDPTLKLLKDRWNAAEQRLKSVHDDLERRIDGDREYANAQQDARQQKTAVDKAKNAVAAGQRKVAQLKQRLAQEQRQQQMKKTQKTGMRVKRSMPGRNRFRLR